ncbi:MAG: ISL3 family transposase [Thermoleophilia bacterium]|nr:ISL3 family transposase [Thermoleophilia bacterium]
MPTNILNLPNFNVQRVEETEHDYHVYAETRGDAPPCSHCGSTSNVRGHGRNPQVIRDLPMHGKRVGIYVDSRRWRCFDCGKTFMEPLPATNAKREMTDRLVKWVGQQSLKRTFASLAEETGLDEKTIRNIFKDHVEELEKTVHFEVPQWMGIDEIHIIKPRCVISNIQHRTIVDMLVNRDKKTVTNYLYNLPGKEAVQFVAMDMWTPYRDAVQAVMPGAQIIIDKFHVVRMANDALERVRKGLREQLSPKQRRGLMHDRFVLLKRERDLTDQDRLLLDGWTANYGALGAAYRAKEDFFAIYDAKSPAEALVRYERWNKALLPEIREAFSDLIRAFTNWQPWIVNYFNHPITNAYAESLNSLIRCRSRIGRGYSFEALRAKMLFSEGVHQLQEPRPKYERQRPTAPARRDFMELTTGMDELDDLELGGAFRGFCRSPDPQYPKVSAKNFGADISTLVKLIESGRL